MDNQARSSAASCRWSGVVPTILRRVYDIDVQPAIDSATTTPTTTTIAPPPRYRPISSIPPTSASRLSQPDARPSIDPFPTEPISASDYDHGDAQDAGTVLYLAYGSNLAASTFLGTRGIRPLSQVNVSAPSLRLVFDLPGMPYREPCFANTAPRKLPVPTPDPPKLPPEVPKLPPEVPKVPDHPPDIKPPKGIFPPPDTDAFGDEDSNTQVDNDREEVVRRTSRGDPVWNKGLIGVVYEVTPSDYAKILATEGGGVSYHDILVPCLPLPPGASIPEHPPVPELPRPFLAHTLYAPRLPVSPPGDGDGENPTPPFPDLPGGIKLPDWLVRRLTPLLLPPRRPDPDYAQPSPRYLGLLRDGAREHDLPGEYQAWLGELAAYHTTTSRQAVGSALFTVVIGPAFILFMVLARMLADDKGRVPAWVGLLMAGWFKVVWWAYDVVFQPVFGDGERTEEVGEDRKKKKGSGKGKSCASLWRRTDEGAVADEEKRCLMEWVE